MKVKLESGASVECEVYDDNGKLVGDFVFCCSSCFFEHFHFSDDLLTISCGNCEKGLGYRLVDEWRRPEDTPGRKHLGFYMDGGFEFVWACTCGNDLHHLVNKLTHTVCEKCEKKTSRRKVLQTMTDTENVGWKI